MQVKVKANIVLLASIPSENYSKLSKHIILQKTFIIIVSNISMNVSGEKM